MNYYEHHLGDWAKKCAHLSLIEEGAYRRLLDWYYTNEVPLPASVREVNKLARCKSPGERDAVKRILAQFFKLEADGWHQSRCDRLLTAYCHSLPVSIVRKEGIKERQKRARERRKVLFGLLEEKDVFPRWNTRTAQLFELCTEHGIPIPVTPPVTRSSRPPVTRDSTHNGREQSYKKVTLEAINPISVTGGSKAPPVNAEVTANAVALSVTSSAESMRADALRACVLAMKKAGFAFMNPHDPSFAALIDAGATPQEFSLVATEAVARDKRWKWLLATVKGRRDDAQRLTQIGVPTQPIQTYKQRAAAALMEEWAPGLARKP